MSVSIVEKDSVTWNYEDINSNLLAVEYNGFPIGYFRIDKDDFVVITEHNHDYPSIPMKILNKIVNEYDEALKVANEIKNKGEKEDGKVSTR